MCHETSHVHARLRLVQESPVAQNKRQVKKKKIILLSRSNPEVTLPYMNPKNFYVTYHFGYRIRKL